MTSKTENGDRVLFALADRMEARLTAAQRQVATLKPSLLARAFAGKLVPHRANSAKSDQIRLNPTQSNPIQPDEPDEPEMGRPSVP